MTIDPETRRSRLSRGLRLLCLCLAVDFGGAPAVPFTAASVGLVAVAATAEARSGSGGYSRPGGSFLGGSRRPSIGGSGGYRRPPPPSGGGFSPGRVFGGDQAISQRAAREALQEYRRSQIPPATAAPTSRRPTAGSEGGWLPGPPVRRPAPSGWGGSTGTAPRFGPWDAVLAWALLNSLSQPGAAGYFRDHQSDPGYAEWRREAENRAAQDPALAQKLAQLDTRMTQPNSGSAARPGNDSSFSPGAGTVWVVVLFGIAILLGLWLWRSRNAAAAAPVPAGFGLAGSERMRFRIGMTIPLDPAPFLLAAPATKIKPPEGGGMISIAAVGLVEDDGVSLHRLYLPGEEAFFQLHLGTDGAADECRYFSLLDQVTPASGDEWGFWLDPAQGMIGWPQFQTKDGKLYDRVWAPGSARVPPRRQRETRQGVAGSTSRQIQAMLYGARTGAAPPAPPFEYVLVGAIEQGGGAWVEIHAGIDINPAALQLPAVPLSS